MFSPTRLSLSVCFTALLSMGSAVSLAASDDEAKLKELERAMNAPATSAAPAKKKYGTRAIVFDNEPQAAAPAEPVKAAAPKDCAALPADVNAIAVDFAIQFKLGSAEVAHESEGTLRQIAKILGLNPERCVLVEGHTDATGNADRNLTLSRERADSVVHYIVEKAGMDRSRLVPIGKGQSDPLKNLDPRNPKNRRVVFKVVG